MAASLRYIFSTLIAGVVLLTLGLAPSNIHLAAQSTTPTATDTTITPTATAIPIDIAGEYSVKTTDADGKTTEASLKILPSTNAILSATLMTGNTTIEGIGLRDRNVVSIALGGKDCGLVAYELAPDGALNGRWVIAGLTISTPGSERVTPKAALPDAGLSPSGEYTFTGRDPSGNAYDGTMTIRKAERLFAVSQLSGGQTYAGLGVLQERIFTWSAFGSGTTCSIVSYRIAPDGTLNGLWVIPDQKQPLTQTAVPIKK